MRKTCFWSVSVIQITMLLGLLTLYSFNMNGQCSCDSDPDVNPGAYFNKKNIGYDANGFVTSYNYMFQFRCMGDPLNNFDFYYYKIIHREKGTTDWTVEEESSGSISSGDIFVEATNLKPCKIYELRVTCPECIQDPNSPLCNSDIQLERYFNDENNTLHNVSRIWEVCYSPISNQPINNFKVSRVDPVNGSVKISWDHLPGEATYTLEYRKKPSLAWLPLGQTDNYTYIINNLEACAEYEVNVRGSVDNCCGSTQKSYDASLSFVMTDCMSTITNVDQVTGNSAHVTWDFLGFNSNPLEFEVQWWKPGSSIMTATVTTNEYTITGLNADSDYNVRIISNCGEGICAGYSQIVKLSTSCELHEPNNNFQTATPVSFNADIGNSNIIPIGDVDYFKFTPTTCFIEVIIDHPDLYSYPNPDPIWWSSIDLPYVLYDQNFQEVPKTEGYWDAQDRWHDNTHMVTVGQEYYMAINSLNSQFANLKCYSFKVFPCDECESLSNVSIFGEENVYSVPSTQKYNLGAHYSQVEWSASGPADITILSNPSTCELYFYETGTVILTAIVTRCDGTSVSIQKEIVVSDECNIEGTYDNGYQISFLYEGLNFVASSNFTIELDLPQGISFNVYPYPLGGDIDWVIDGNKIIVSKFDSGSSLRIILWGGNCNGKDGVYTFIIRPPGLMEPPVEWMISPNPTSNLLQITPAILPGVDPNTVPSTVEIRLINQNSNLVLTHQGTTAMATSLNLVNIQPGSYSLQLLYGEYWQQYTVIKQ